MIVLEILAFNIALPEITILKFQPESQAYTAEKAKKYKTITTAVLATVNKRKSELFG